MRKTGKLFLLLICGLVTFPVSNLVPPDLRAFYLAGISAVFLLVVLRLRWVHREGDYWRLLFAFFVASIASLTDLLLYMFVRSRSWSGATIEGIISLQLASMIAITVPIILLIRISGDSLSSIYLKKGKLRLGLVIGIACFLAFYVTAIPGAEFLFYGQALTTERLISWTPAILAFTLSNGFREELWFRGLFLKKYQSILGPETGNFLQALVFGLAHLTVQYTPILLGFMIITFLLGLGFGAVMRRTDSLLAPALFHAGADIPVIVGIFSTL